MPIDTIKICPKSVTELDNVILIDDGPNRPSIQAPHSLLGSIRSTSLLVNLDRGRQRIEIEVARPFVSFSHQVIVKG
jgi:hypothetical protein